MSDAVAAAAITGVVAVAGYIATYLGTTRQADTTVKAAERQAEVELAKVEAENERLREQFREAERQNRQGTYHRMISVLNRFDTFATSASMTEEAWQESLDEYFFLHAGILMFGDEGVSDALSEVTDVLSEIGADFSTKQGSLGDRWRDAYNPRRADFVNAQGAVLAAMRVDVTRGLLP